MPQLRFPHWRFGRTLVRGPDVPGSHNTEHSAIRLTVVKAERARNTPAVEPALQTFLEQVLSSAGAISAAIVVGAVDGMRCRAKIGATVPEVVAPSYCTIALGGWF